MKVYKQCCKNCLLSKDSIVSPARRKDILQDCAKNQTHFFCHKSTMEGKEIVCKSFYDKLGHVSQMLRIAGRLNVIEFVDQPADQEKLITHSEMEAITNEDKVMQKEWVCNECNTPNFTQSVPKEEIENEMHACVNCGCFEFHLESKKLQPK